VSGRSAGLIERTLNHERLFVVVSLCAVIIACWAFVLTGAGTGMSTFAMSSWSMAIGAPEALSRAVATPVAWTPSYALTMIAMWWVMMIAMMLPSASPVILLHAKVSSAEGSAVPSIVFTSGYALAWGGFSLAAAATQWLLESAGVLSPFMMNTSSAIFAGMILVYAGAYQLSPLKRACLRHCQSPLGFLTHHWQSGTWGALRMGLHHGVYCLGCCAGLMAILFFGGIMNLYWIGGLAILLLLEKLLPAGMRLSYLTGPALILWGLTFFIRAWS
jgi:predicted metal-binding membrane protein